MLILKLIISILFKIIDVSRAYNNPIEYYHWIILIGYMGHFFHRISDLIL